MDSNKKLSVKLLVAFMLLPIIVFIIATYAQSVDRMEALGEQLEQLKYESDLISDNINVLQYDYKSIMEQIYNDVKE